MYQIDFDKPEHIHFIGIGGISMSGLAEILLDAGFTVSGSDAHETELTRHLTEKGARIYYGQRAANIEQEPGIQAVVYTAAIHGDNPELMAVRAKGLPELTRAELLGELMRNYKQSIAIAGTHGKNDHYLYADRYSVSRRHRPYDFCRRYPEGYRRKYTGRRA